MYVTCYTCHVGALSKAEDILEWNMGLVLTTTRILLIYEMYHDVVYNMGKGKMFYFSSCKMIYFASWTKLYF